MDFLLFFFIRPSACLSAGVFLLFRLIGVCFDRLRGHRLFFFSLLSNNNKAIELTKENGDTRFGNFSFWLPFLLKIIFWFGQRTKYLMHANVEICMMNVDCRASASHQWLLKSATRSAGFMLFPLRGMAIIVIVWRTQRRPGGSRFLALWFGCDVDLTVLCFFFLTETELIPKPAQPCEAPPLYLRLRMGKPVERKMPMTTPIMSYGKKKMKPEYWFSIPRDK